MKNSKPQPTPASQKQVNFINELMEKAQEKGLTFSIPENPTSKEASILIYKMLKALKEKGGDKKAAAHSSEQPGEKKGDNEQAKLKAEAMDIISQEESSESMRKYYNSCYDYFVRLSNGGILAIDKPRIETRFCFGYGQCGISSDEEEKNACEMEEYASTDERYFLKENLRELNDRINKVETLGGSYNNPLIILIIKNYHGIYDFSIWDKWTYEERKHYLEVDHIADEQERQDILEGLKEVKKHFEKRLQTYLKRYGLSKLDTWTYLVD